MTLKEKALYHQIHPLKPLTDISTAVVALALLWRHALWPALIVALAPSIGMSVLCVRYADLAKYRDSALGRYLRRSMIRPVQAVRLAGFLVMALGSWWHAAWFIALGLGVILLAWCWGVVSHPRAHPGGTP